MFPPSFTRLLLAAALLVLLATGCSTPDAGGPAVVESDGAAASGSSDPGAQAPTANLTDGCAQDPEPGTDLFPAKVAFDVATGISVEYHDTHKLVTIDHPTDAADAQPITLALVQCGAADLIEGDLAADVTIEVPVGAVATYSTTFTQGFELIDRLDVLAAHGGLQYVSSEAVLAAADAGQVAEVGDQTAPDLEALAAADPDVIIVSAGFGGADAVEPFAALDVPVFPNASYLETDPLGRAEWMKLEALLLNEEAAVTPVFEQVATEYAELTALVADVEDRPTVLTNAPFEGTWFLSSGDSYTNALIEAAGGAYVFADLEGPSTTPLDLESVLAEAQDADVWLQAGSVAVPPEQLLAADERLGLFAAFPDQVWANDGDLGPTGGNRFYEDGAVRPDLVLADVIAILHPELLPDHELRFFGRLGSQAAVSSEPGGDG